MLKYIVRFGALSLLALSASLMSFAQNSAADTYKAKCQMCHAADGSANTPAGKAMKALPFNSPELIAKSDADLIAVVKNGKGKMPAFAGKLTDAQVKSLVTYIRATFQKKK